MTTHYETLSIDIKATQEEIKIAYKSKCLETHPDKGGSAELFDKVKKAYDILRDVNKRTYYDKYGDLDPNGTEDSAIQKLMKALFNPNVEDHLVVPYRNLKGHLETITAKCALMSKDILSLEADLETLKDKEDISLIYNRLKDLLLERKQMFLLVERERVVCESVLSEFNEIENLLGRNFMLELLQGQGRYNV